MVPFIPKTDRNHEEPSTTPDNDSQSNGMLGDSIALSGLLVWGGLGAIESLYALPHFQIHLLKWLSI